MAGERPRDYPQRVRALRKRLALDFQPLRSTLARGLDVLIDPEAAVLCTATVEAVCDALFHVVVKNVHDDAAASRTPLDTKVSVAHLHVALRGDSDLALLLTRVPGATAVLECFLDDTSSRALYERQLLATREAKHLRPSPATLDNDNDIDRLGHSDHSDDDEQQQQDHERHARTRSEWQKRDDDPFSDVDFATVLKCVHPAFSLTHSATLLLSALVRELLNAACDLCDLERVQHRVPPEMYVDDVAVPLARVCHAGEQLGRAVDKTARECLERFRLRSQQGTTLTLRCRVFAGGAAVRLSGTSHALAHVPRDACFGAGLLLQLCKKCRVDAATYVAVYRGHTIDAAATPRTLGMPTGAVVFLVRATWWDHTRRNEARRGMLLAPARCGRGERGERGGGGGDERSPQKKEEIPHLEPFAVPPRRNKVTGTKDTTVSVHAASASRLLGVGGIGVDSTTRGSAGRRGWSDSEDQDSDGSNDEGQADDEHNDSLSRLLRQRHQDRARRGNNMDSLPPPRRTVASSTRRELLTVMTAQSAQLMDTLDEAWLGFAGISASVRSMKEEFQTQLEAETEDSGGGGRGGGGGGGGADMCTLENELRVRLEKTGELVKQTRTAHDLVAQLLQTTQRMQSGADEETTVVGSEQRRRRK